MEHISLPNSPVDQNLLLAAESRWRMAHNGPPATIPESQISKSHPQSSPIPPSQDPNLAPSFPIESPPNVCGVYLTSVATGKPLSPAQVFTSSTLGAVIRTLTR